jgi:hypothetical protein
MEMVELSYVNDLSELESNAEVSCSAQPMIIINVQFETPPRIYVEGVPSAYKITSRQEINTCSGAIESSNPRIPTLYNRRPSP